jgi:uncharacterized membrane protein
MRGNYIVNAKPFYKSLTILSALLALAVQLAPVLGFTFTAEDAALISTNIDAIITALAALGVVVGRVNAHTDITLATDTRNGTTLHSPWHISLIITFMALASCGSTTGTSLPGFTPGAVVGSAREQLAQAERLYATAYLGVTVYRALPTCGTSSGAACKNLDLARKLTSALNEAGRRLEHAREVLNDPEATDETIIINATVQAIAIVTNLLADI